MAPGLAPPEASCLTGSPGGWLHVTSKADTRLQFAALVFILLLSPFMTKATIPCVYEGHVKTSKDWYGYLANITIMTTGRLVFEFTYPAERCCQNVLFYLDDQVTILNQRMNCWQKEALLMIEKDQILRLTPMYTWSGCHMTRPEGHATYKCVGGRSFTSTSNANKPTTYHIAISNCASLAGLDLHYRLELMGHVGECITPSLKTTLRPFAIDSGAKNAGSVQYGDPPRSPDNRVSDKPTCVIKGAINVTSNWFGFIANITLNKGGGFSFAFILPYNYQVTNVVLYNAGDVQKLRKGQNCWQKEGIIRSRHVPEQIVDLSFRASWNGCVSRNRSRGTRELVCRGERWFNNPRDIFVAVSNCRSDRGLVLKYELRVTGYHGALCSSTSQLSSVSAILFLLQLLCVKITRD